MELVVHADGAELARAAADRIAGLISAGEGRFSLGLAGGTTPEATYRELRGLSPGWDRVDAWLSDERWVPHDDVRSNGRMVSEILTGPLAIGLHRPAWGDEVGPADSAADYETSLRSIHESHPPDLILLGLGGDGHTASLFPGTRALDERERWFVANDVPQLGETRLTATFPLLSSARMIMFLVVGAAKATALAESMERRTPAGLLSTSETRVEWHVDREAASLLG